MSTQLHREQLYPWLCGLWVIAVILVAGDLDASIPHGEGYKGAILTLGGVFAGFMATLNALLFAMQDTAFQRLKDSGYLKDLVRYLQEAIWASLALCLSAAVAFWIPDSYWYVEAFIGGVVAFTTTAVFRISIISAHLLASRH